MTPAQKRNHSPAAIARRKRYERSVKGKATKRRYWASPKGRTMLRAAWKRHAATPARRAYVSRWWKKVSGFYTQRRRARMIKNGIRNQTAVRKIYTRAQELRQWFDVVVDHIIPLVKGGAHSPENLQIIYRVENRQKGTSLTYAPSVIFL